MFGEGCRFVSFTKHIKNIARNIGKNLSGKYSPKRLEQAKPSATDTPKITSKRVIHKTVEATGDLIGYIIADKIARISRTSPQNTQRQLQMKQKALGLIEKHHKIYLQRP